MLLVLSNLENQASLKNTIKRIPRTAESVTLLAMPWVNETKKLINLLKKRKTNITILHHLKPPKDFEPLNHIELIIVPGRHIGNLINSRRHRGWSPYLQTEFLVFRPTCFNFSSI